MFARIKKYFIENRRGWLYLLLLVSVFSFSVVLRFSNLQKPMGRHHEWLTAHSLIIMQAWNQHGIGQSCFAPIYNYKNPGDKNDHTLCALHDKDGNAYYVSYGPFSSLLPYVLFKITGIPINEYSLKTFNLVLHFFTAFFLYLLVLRLSDKGFNDFSLAALVTFTMYVFSAGTLWFHGNVYFSEILAQFFLAAGLYVFYNLYRLPDKKTLLWYSITGFAFVYTEWLGLLFLFFTGVFFLVKTFRKRVYLKPFLVAAGTGVFALSLLIWQYAQIAGFDRLKEVSVNKFHVRNGGSLVSSMDQNDFTMQGGGLKKIEAAINGNFLNVINTMAFVLPLFILMVCYRRKYFLTPAQLLLLCLCLCMVLSHHLLFFNFTAMHDFSVLKTGLFMILLVGLFLSRLEMFSLVNREARWVFILAVVVFTGVKSYGAWRWYKVWDNTYPEQKIYMSLGEKVKAENRPSERVFSNLDISPMANYYAGRNIQYAKNAIYAREWAIVNKEETVFFFVEKNSVLSATHYTIQGDSVYVNLVHE